MGLNTVETDAIVAPAWLEEHRGDAGLKIVDVRPIEHFMNGHIPGAISLDVMSTRLLSSAQDAVTQWKQALERLFRNAGIETTDTLVAYEDISGTAAAYAVWLGDVAGLAGSALLDGGFNAWLASGHEISGDPVQPTPGSFELTVNEAVIATAQTLAHAIANEEPIQIVDTRTDQEFATATIPGANHLEWTRTLNPDGSFRLFEEIRRDYEDRGFDLDSTAPITTFCGSGLRAAHSYVVLKQLGVKQPQNYGPSWSEWGRQPQLPKRRPDSSEV
jgi:thiosulfate/3-mercaptopyruvate sulfurtransferase